MIDKSHLLFALSFCACVLDAGMAFANPIKTVGTAIVNKGASTFEVRAGWSGDDQSKTNNGRWQLRQQYDYGVTDMYAIRFTAIQDDAGNGNLEHNAVQWDNRFQIFENKKHGFDGGFRASYVFRDGDKKPDIVDVRWINHFPIKEVYEFRHHVILQHQVGHGSRNGFMPELRWQFTAPVTGTHRAGVEMFNEFGNIRDDVPFQQQGHDAGVVAMGPLYTPLWGEAVRYQVGYRHGISRNAPDHSVKFFIGYNF